MKQFVIYRIMAGILFFTCILTSELKAQADMDTTMMAGPIVADRPNQSDGATILAKGYFQMENGVSIEDIKPGFVYTYPSTLWKIGVSESFEFRVLTEYINITHEGLANIDGLLPVQVGFKTKLFNQNGIIPKAAAIGFLSLPGIASKQFQTTYFAPSMRLAFEHQVTNSFSVAYNVGAEWNGEDARPNFLYTFSLQADVFHGLGAYIEAYGDVPQQREDDFQHRLDGGLTYLVSDDVVVDVSGGIGLSDNAPERYVAVGLSYRFKM
ncbi:MAG: transporter [Saprospiraceae bacterium]|uniref:Transporter n=1 Tax=Candidatus Opimibacter skivensis TaxID=2982028 RepID=A0A9D7STS9_9BACT|nr:transporter [Candidatus Opimibacter skivensis]